LTRVLLVELSERLHMEKFLKGRTALITGAVQGIGLAIAEALASAGARIVHGLPGESKSMVAVEVIVMRARPRPSPAGAELMFWSTTPAGGHTASFVDASHKVWDDIIAINLSGAFDTVRHALPEMRRRGYGRVINVASVHGLVASVNKAPYVAAKFGLVGMSRVAALEYASEGSRDTRGRQLHLSRIY
jgi:3-hydroxybutyrate dehydrogenase